MTGKAERYEFDWRDPLSGASIRIGVKLRRDYISPGQTHLDIESLSPKKAPLPISRTGYLSYFIAPLELSNAGGPVVYVRAWLDREAAGKAWRKQSADRAQGDLFAWAAARKETAEPKLARRAATRLKAGVALKRSKPRNPALR